MSNLMVIENKISSIEKYLKILEKYKNYSSQELQANPERKGAVERYLYLAVQAAIDLADALIAYQGFRKPTTMSDSFYILEEEGWIDSDLTSRLAKMTGFRNVIAHDYEKIDYTIVRQVLDQGLQDIKRFIAVLKNKLGL